MISVVIPTYRRPYRLLDCIASIVTASRRPQEIIVVGREGDSSTNDALAKAKELCAGKTDLRTGWVTEPGHIPPIEGGLKCACGDIVAFVDDDVTVTTEWLDRLILPFNDPSVGVVGGRVITAGSMPVRLKGHPGCLSWYGKHWGNISCIEGERPLEVEAVMEGNCAWRRALLASLRFDPVLNFDDGSMYGLDLCLQAGAKGYRIVYEPRSVVHHHVAPRAPGLDREDRIRRAFSYSRNYTYLMLKHLDWWRRPVFLAWWFIIGERASWGFGAVLADAMNGRVPNVHQIRSMLRGKVEGLFVSVMGARARAH